MHKAIAVVICLAAASMARSEDPVPSPEAPHKGAWLEVPDATARFEIVWAKDKKCATVYSYQLDGTTPLGLKDAPELSLPALDEKNPLRGRALNLKDGAATEFEFKAPPAVDGQPLKEQPPQLGPHGGAWIDIPGSTKFFLEYIHDVKLGRVTVWFYGEDGKTLVPINDAPVFNVDTPLDGIVLLEGKAAELKGGAASRFDFEGADLAQRPPGGGSRFALRIEKKPYQAPIVNVNHGHMHGPGGVAAPK